MNELILSRPVKTISRLVAASSKRGGSSALLLIAVAILGCFSASGCGNSADEPKPITAIAAPAFARKWATSLDIPKSDAVASIHVSEDWLIVYTVKGRACMIRRSDGLPIFNVEVPGGSARLWAPVVLKDYIVFPTTTMLEIYTLAGIHERSLDVRAAIRADCVAAPPIEQILSGRTSNPSVFVPVDSPNGGARIKCFDLTAKATDVAKWELEVQKGSVASAPAMNTDAVYFAADVGVIYAVSADQREPIWPLPGNVFDARAGVVAPLKIDEAGLYISCVDGKFYSVNRTSGAVKWQYYASGPLEDAPVPMSDTLYLHDPNVGWCAIDKLQVADVKVQFNRKPRWSDAAITQILAQDDKYTYVADKGNHLVALDKKTGEAKFRSARNDFYRFGTNFRDSTSYVVSKTGRVVAVMPVFQQGSSGELVKLEDNPEPKKLLALDR